MIRLENISVTFGQGTPLLRQALHPINLEILPNEFVVVIGTNGAGKSTLLSTITGDIRPDTGDIYLDQKCITSWAPIHRSTLIGKVFQDPFKGTCAQLTIEENLAVALRRGRSRLLGLALNPERRRFFQEQLAPLNLGLENRLQTPVYHLSGGQRQALALVMATISPMEVLLMDEPTAALDPKTAKELLQLTQSIIDARHLTTLMVTHSLHHALELGTRTIMLHEGRIVLDVSGAERRKLKVQDLYDRFENL